MEIEFANTNQMSLEYFESGSMDHSHMAVQDTSNATAQSASVVRRFTPDADSAFQRFMETATSRGDVELKALAPCRDELGIDPSYPATGTQPARLLSALLFGKEIDPLAGWLTLGIYRLSDTVYQLRNLGWPVITGRLDVKNRFGEECHVANYYLAQDAINAAGDRGREFRNVSMTRKDAA